MPGFVPDASVTLSWCFEDEATAATDALLKSLKADAEGYVPAHWLVEVTNGLVMVIRRARISKAKAQRFLEDLAMLPIFTGPAGVLTCRTVLDLAGEHKLTAYDAAYLEIAIRLGLPLATTDEALRRAANNAGVTLEAVR